MAGRARAANRAEHVDRTWMKWARCSVCRGRFCVNNFPHRKIDKLRYRFLNQWLCPKCRYHEGEFFIKLMILTKRMAEGLDMNCGGEPEDCKCNAHVVLRLLTKHAEVKT